MDPLFKSARISPASGLGYSLVTLLTLGMVKVYRLSVEPDNLYLVDVGYNHVYVYDGAVIGHNEKFFWKINIDLNPVPRVEHVPKRFSITVNVPNIPIFDPQFDNRGVCVVCVGKFPVALT